MRFVFACALRARGRGGAALVTSFLPLQQRPQVIAILVHEPLRPGDLDDLVHAGYPAEELGALAYPHACRPHAAVLAAAALAKTSAAAKDSRRRAEAVCDDFDLVGDKRERGFDLLAAEPAEHDGVAPVSPVAADLVVHRCRAGLADDNAADPVEPELANLFVILVPRGEVVEPVVVGDFDRRDLVFLSTRRRLCPIGGARALVCEGYRRLASDRVVDLVDGRKDAVAL